MIPERKAAILAIVETLLDMIETPSTDDVNEMEADILNLHLVDMDIPTLATCAAIGAGLLAGAHGEHERRGLA